ncbi:MAG: DNA primase [Thermoleophilaceae bacterium]
MAALYTQDSIERTREAVDMVELVSTRTELRRVGARWVGLCPFHDERTPSFSVDAERKLYNCFGCGVGGDAITFVRELDALDFPGAVESLAERYNVELKREREDPEAEERRRRRERLLALLERAAGFYATYLLESTEARRAREYLAGRGLSPQVLGSFRVGYAPKAWDRLLLGAQRDGFRPEELLAAGLVQRGRSGGLLDRFRGRIMFPLADARGRVLGFGARAMRDEQGAKYINTSENEIYHKGRQLFGIDRARAAAAKAGRVVVVEGYTDVLALHQAGIEETVAVMGTALTSEQLGELARAAGRDGTVFLCFDADRSGQDAMLRAAVIARDRDLQLRVVQMPAGQDPADLVAAEGPEGVSERLAEALSVLEFEVARVFEDEDLQRPEGRDRALGRVRGLIAAAPERSAGRDHLVRLVADRLDVPVDYVVASVERGPAPGESRPPDAAAAPRPEAVKLDAEGGFLALCAGAGERGDAYLARLTDAHLPSPTLRAARDHLRAHPGDPLAELPEQDRDLAALLTAIAVAADARAPATEGRLRTDFLGLERILTDRELRRATAAGDFPRQRELAQARQRLRSEHDAAVGEEP